MYDQNIKTGVVSRVFNTEAAKSINSIDDQLERLAKNIALVTDLFHNSTNRFQRVVNPEFYLPAAEAKCLGEKIQGNPECPISEQLRGFNSNLTDLIANFEYFIKNCEL